MPANTLALGAAFQRGLLPVSGEALEQAIELNGAAVEKNLAAFALGPRGGGGARTPSRPPRARPRRSSRCASSRTPSEYLVDARRERRPGELRRLAELRVPELVAYQDADWRAALGRARAPACTRPSRSARRAHSELTEAVARQLYKLMAYKDEYEVARLHLDAVERAKLGAEFGEDAKVYFMLHPPLLRALGMKRKLKLGRWFVPGLPDAVPRCAACAARRSTRSAAPRCGASSAR